MRAGLASCHVAAIRFSLGCGMRAIGIRERTRGLETCGSGLLRVLSDISHAPSLVKLRSPVERPRTCHHHAGRRGSLARGDPCSFGEDVIAIALDRSRICA